MSKIVLYIAISLDGFIARKDGTLDWLDALPNPNKLDHGYNDFYSTIGATIMGRKTYDEIIGFGVDWPYSNVDSYVITSDEKLTISSTDTYVVQEDVEDFIGKLKEKNTKDIWLVGGGQLVSYFINNDLLDKMIITVIPTIIGEGIPLFPNKPKETSWTLLETQSFETGAVALTYEKK